MLRKQKSRFTQQEEKNDAGLGFMVMESFMDQMKVTSKVGKGTVVVLQKEIERKQAKGANG